MCMDTKQTVLDLLATGITQQELADMVPCSQSLPASGWVSGSIVLSVCHSELVRHPQSHPGRALSRAQPGDRVGRQVVAGILLVEDLRGGAPYFCAFG